MQREISSLGVSAVSCGKSQEQTSRGTSVPGVKCSMGASFDQKMDTHPPNWFLVDGCPFCKAKKLILTTFFKIEITEKI